MPSSATDNVYHGTIPIWCDLEGGGNAFCIEVSQALRGAAWVREDVAIRDEGGARCPKLYHQDLSESVRGSTHFWKASRKRGDGQSHANMELCCTGSRGTRRGHREIAQQEDGSDWRNRHLEATRFQRRQVRERMEIGSVLWEVNGG